MMKSKNPRILVVEDEPDVCASIQSYLGRRGYQISVTSSGTEALSLINLLKPDAVILDFALNDLDGREALSRLRKYDPATKIIVVTGKQLNEREIKKIRGLGISEYFTKPVLLDQLEAAIRKILSGDFTFEAVAPKPGPKKHKRFSSGTVHKLSNILGIIRNSCENFILNMEDGLYKDLSDKEIVQKSLFIMKDAIKSVDQATDIVQTIKEE